MGRALVSELKNIRDKVNDLSIGDEKAKALEAFIDKSVEIITNMSSPNDEFFEGRKKLALDDLQNHSSKHLRGYWEEKGKIEKISEFSRARSEASQALNSILACFKNK